MRPLFSPTAPWASRAVILAALVSLPIVGLITREAVHQQALTQKVTRAEQQLRQRQQMLDKLHETQKRRARQSHQLNAIPPAIRLMDSVGSAMSPEIALLNIDINPSQRDVRLTVNATSLPALLAFSERLQQLPAQVVLENHRPSSSEASGWPLAASLDVHFVTEEAHATKK
ncbi:hypothetical protein [Enterobacter sp. CC120223-11]|uniref:hypothetical protein n=1 Tax=Enterobacter sp. CC120223-11 TaxID=1378073 RepID=UPI000BD33C03|nr:hypothetical protein [Enterobacter sp. CC120223-11]SNY65724.1 hypothetical protein SAMN02744775_01396 [Enterobacter sp. CC120223-11]